MLDDRPVQGLSERYTLGRAAGNLRGNVAHDTSQLASVDPLTAITLFDFGSERVQKFVEDCRFEYRRKFISDFSLEALEVADEVGMLNNVHFDLLLQLSFDTNDVEFAKVGSAFRCILLIVIAERFDGLFDCFVSLACLFVFNTGATLTCKIINLCHIYVTAW